MVASLADHNPPISPKRRNDSVIIQNRNPYLYSNLNLLGIQISTLSTLHPFMTNPSS